MKKLIFALCGMLLLQTALAQTAARIDAGVTVRNTGVQVNLGLANFINNGTYTDTTGTSAFTVRGGTTFDGTGTTRLYDLVFTGGGASVCSTQVSVYNSATIAPGASVNANGNLYLRTDLHSGAHLVNNGVLTGNVDGLQTYSSILSAGCPYIADLSVNVSGSSMAYHWQSSADNSTWGDISGGTNATYSASASTATYYRCRLSCINSVYGQATPSVYLIPTGGPAITTTGTVYCQGSNGTLTASGATTYSWMPATGLSASTGASVTVAATSTTTYTVTGTTGGCSSTATAMASVNPLPAVSAGSNTAICAGSAGTTLTATGSIHYTWTPGTGLSSTVGASVTANPGATTTYTVTGTNAEGCSNTAAVTVSVNALPAVSGGANVAICASSGATTLTATGATTYTWTPGTGLSSTMGASVSANPTATTTYTVTGTSAAGCTNTAIVTVSVNALPAVSGGANVAICASGATTLTATGAATYTWTPGTGLSSTVGASVTANPGATTTYTVTGTNAEGCSNTAAVTVSVNALPAVSGGANVAICASSGGTTLTATGATTYTWTPGTGLSSTVGASVTANPGATTTYTVTGTNAEGCSNTAAVTVSVNALPAVSGGANVAICASGSTTLTATGATTYIWTPGTGLSSTMGASVSANPGATTTYTVTGTNAEGCSNTAAVTVSVNALPAVSGGADVAICASSGATTLTATGAATYTWTPGTGLSSTVGASVTADPAATTTYTVTGTSAAGCINTATVTVTVNALPAVNAGPDVHLCAGTGSATLTATGAVTYTWDPSGALSASTGATVLAPNRSQTYMVTGTDANGCMNTDTVAVIVDSLPVISAGPGVATCAGTAVTLTASGGATYTWLPSTGLSASTGATVVANPAGTTTYSIAGINAMGCVDTATIVVTINPLPAVSAGASLAICAGAATTLVATGANTYVWSPADGLSATVGASVSASPTVTTTYTVLGTNLAGCTNTAVVTVTVNALPVVTTNADVTICYGNTATLSAAGAVSYSWSPATGLSATVGAAVAASPTVTTTYTVTGISAAGCSNTASVTVSVNPLPNTTVFTSPSASSPCQGMSGTVTVNSTTLGAGIFNVMYNITGANSSAGNTATLTMGSTSGTFIIPSAVLPLTGNTTVTITSVISMAGCSKAVSAANTALFTVNVLPVAYTVTGGGVSCTGSAGSTIGLSGSQTGVTYQLYNGASTVGSAMTGTGGALSFGFQTAAGSYTVLATRTTTGCTKQMSGSVAIAVTPLPTVYAVTGGGTYCSGTGGVHIGLSNSQTGVNYQAYRGSVADGAAVPGTGSALDMGLKTTAGSYTVVATNPAGGCTSNMSGSATVIVNASPTVYTVTGGGTYCAGGVGYHVGLSGSQTGMSYQLYRDGSAEGTPRSGTGSGLDWGYETAAGTYTVIATATSGGCTSNMTGSAVIVVNPLPVAFTVTGGGGYCSGSAGVHVGLSGSQTGVNYQLYKGSSLIGYPVAGSGATLDFGVISAVGTYSVSATAATGSCAKGMSGTVTISINTLPTAYTVTVSGGGTYCTGSTAPHVGLANSQIGVNYQLYASGVATGAAIAGVGGTLDFGAQAAAATYTVVAANATTGCTANMSNSVAITTTSVPASAAVTGGGTICAGTAGVHVGLASSSVVITYYLYRNGTGIGSLAGTGSALDYGLYNVAGTYTVVAVNNLTACTSNQLGSAVINVVAAPTAGTITGPTTVTDGGTITLADATAGGTWSASNTHVSISSGGVVTGVSAGTVTISYTVSNGVCAVSALYYITETGSHRSMNPMTYGNNILCTGGTTQLANTVSGGIWTSGNTSVATIDAESGMVSGISEGTAAITYTVGNGANPMAVYCSVTVLGVPDAVTITANPGTVFTAGQAVTFSAAVNNNKPAASYQWLVNGDRVANGTEQHFTTAALADNDEVSCQVAGDCGAVIMAAVRMTTGSNQVGIITPAAGVVVSPNPNRGTFTIKGNVAVTATEVVTIEVTDVLGKVIYTRQATAARGMVNETVTLAGWVANGMYILSLKSDAGTQVLHVAVDQ